jgi:hypothetical protein
MEANMKIKLMKEGIMQDAELLDTSPRGAKEISDELNLALSILNKRMPGVLGHPTATLLLSLLTETLHWMFLAEGTHATPSEYIMQILQEALGGEAGEESSLVFPVGSSKAVN